MAGGKWYALKSPDGRSWTLGDLAITLQEVEGTLEVIVHAQKVSLVHLAWKYDVRGEEKFLGDHWERSYGDLAWKPVEAERVMPWYVLIHDGKTTAGFGVKTGCPSMASWQVGNGGLSLFLDTRSGGEDVLPLEGKLVAARVLVHSGTERPYVVAHEFCKKMCDAPLLPREPVYGTNDWYYTYGHNSEKQILDNCRVMSTLAPDGTNRPFAVVDAGWAVRASRPDDTTWGDDFSVPNANFPSMEGLTRQIRETGMRPGIWLRPLCAHPRDPESMLIPGTRFLDPTIPENLSRVARYFSTSTAWGYDLVKFDFTTFDILGKWGFAMGRDVVLPARHFHDTTLTNAQVFLKLYETIRAAAGKTVVLGCNTISHLSAGMFEVNRIGDDTSGLEWARTRKMGVNTLGCRIVQHNAFYAADGDCVGLTAKVPWEKNKQWMQLLAESGTPLFISAQLEALGTEQREMIRRSFLSASGVQQTGEPLDWMENPVPRKWNLNGRVVEFDWE
jgi:alpha-galactosidase